MRNYFLFVLLLAGNILCGQQGKKIEKFYDYNWKACDVSIARYYAAIEFKDSLWFRNDYFIRENKLQMKGTYKDSACKIAEGMFHYFHANGNLSSKGEYRTGKKEGLWLSYHSNTMMRDSAFYSKGQLIGIRQQWYANGYPMDSSVYDSDGKGVHINWFDNGSPASAGRSFKEKLYGKWQYFHKNGNLSAVEVYDAGKLISRVYYDEQNTPMSDTTNHDSDATFPGGNKAWNKYIYKQLYFPDQYKITGGDRAIVVVTALVDEEGNVTNVEISSPFHPEFDKIAIKGLQKSPKWKPAINHNRRVSQEIRLPVTFGQPES